MTRILILGATGHIAMPAARALSERDGIQLRLTSHRDEGVAQLQAEFADAEVVKLDWTNRADMIAAFADVDRAMMVTPDFTDERTVIANVVAGIGSAPRFELLARLIAIGPITDEDMTEEWLGTNCGAAMHWTARAILQDTDLPIAYINVPTYTAFNLTWLAGEAIRTRRELPMTGDAARLWISEDDIGQVFAKILSDAAKHVGQEYVLTGPERLRYGDLANILTDELGETVTWVESPAGYSDAVGDRAGAYKTYAKYSSKHAHKQPPTDNIKNLLGRPATTMRDYIRQNLAILR